MIGKGIFFYYLYTLRCMILPTVFEKIYARKVSLRKPNARVDDCRMPIPYQLKTIKKMPIKKNYSLDNSFKRIVLVDVCKPF